jgi:ATP-dependent DNA helicase RecQ
LQKDAQQIRISLDAGDDSCIRLRPLGEEEPDPLGFCVLTDRRIRYKELGKVVVSEKEKEGGETSEVHTFEFQKPALKASFQYFLQNFFRKADFKPGQLAIINRAIQGKDVIGLLPTGGGKSLTFQLCALLQPGVTVVVDPINSLMKDQFDKLIDNGITRASFINSFNTKDERTERMQALADGQFQILFVSPERFQMENFRQSLSACRDTGVYFSYAVIDEAHCVSEWGHDFRHVYLNLAQNLKRFCHPKSGPLTIFGLTATASFDVLADVQRELDLKEDAIANAFPSAVSFPTISAMVPIIEPYASSDCILASDSALAILVLASAACWSDKTPFLFSSSMALYRSSADRISSAAIPLKSSICAAYWSLSDWRKLASLPFIFSFSSASFLLSDW